MDEVARYNLRRWQALAKSKAIFTCPYLDLDEAVARQRLDPAGRLGEIKGKRVLCLAGGGGQQSAAFALLGAEVTVIDLSAAQIERDYQAAAHYGLRVQAFQGDMRDLSRFDAGSFDVVWQPYSLNFVPNAREVFAQVARVLGAGGIYHFMCANPFVAGVIAKDWDGQGYSLKAPYVDGAEVSYEDESWIYRGEQPVAPVSPVREYRQTLGTLINGLVEQGFLILSVSEENIGQPDFRAQPGTTEHLTSIAPPWLIFWASHRPEVLAART